jgi:PAS domain S-box-containing protein
MTEQTVPKTPSATSLPLWRQMRWNLVLLFIALAVLPLAVAVVITLTETNAQAQQQVSSELEIVAELKSDQIKAWLAQGDLAMDLFLAGQRTSVFVDALTSETADSSRETGMTDLLVAAVEADPYFNRLFVYDGDGKIIASSNAADVGTMVDTQPYFRVSFHADYIQEPFYEADTGELRMFITRPLRAGTVQAVGVLAGQLNIDRLGAIMLETTGLGETGETYLVSLQNNYLLTPSRFEGYPVSQAYRSTGIDSALRGKNGSGTYNNYQDPPVKVIGVYRWIPELSAALLAEESEAEALQTFTSARNTSMIVAAVAAVVAVIIGLWSARRISNPLTQLAQTAARVAGGDLTQRVKLRQRNEVGLLASVFDNMTSQLQELVGSLEDRVAARTRDLFLTLEVGQLATRVYNREDLLTRIADYIQQQFDLYYTQVYVIDDAQRYAVLKAGTGEVGEQLLGRNHKLDLREVSIVARAARTRRPVLVVDTEISDVHRPNPLLPETRSEVAVPLIVGDQVLGVLDMQSQHAAQFNEDNLPVFEAMANQLAAALNSARSFGEARTAVERADAINRRLTQERWESYLGRVGTGERVSYQYDLQSVRPLDGDDGVTLSGNGGGGSPQVMRPVTVRNQTIGTIALAEDGERVWSDGDMELIDAVADRVAQTLEQFRAFDETYRRAVEMQTVAEVGAEASATLDPEQLLQTISELVKDRFALYHAHVYLVDEAGQNLALAAGAGEAGQQMVAQGRRIPVSHQHSLVARAARSRQGVIVNDVTEAADFLPNPVLPETRAEMAVPMIVGDALIGILDVQSQHVGRFTEDDVQVLSTLASQVAVAVQNARSFRDAVDAEAELREQQTLLRSIIDTSPDWIFAKDTNYRYLLVNKSFAEFYGGLSPEEMVGKDDYDLGTPVELIEGDPEQGIVGFRVDDRAVVEGHETIHNPNDVVDHTDGTRHVYDTNKLPLRDASGNVIGVLGVSRDMTDQRVQEEVIRKRAVEMQAVAEVGAEAAATLDPDELLQTVADLTQERFDLYHAHIYLLDEAGQNLVLTAGAGEIGRQMVATGHTIALDSPRSLVARAARASEAVVVNNVREAPDFLPNPRLPRTRAEMAIPMIVGDQLIGVLDVQASEVDYFTDADVQVQSTLASQVAVAVQNTRLFADSQESQKRFQDIALSSADWVWEVDAQGRYTYCSDRVVEVLGYTVEEMLGKTPFDFMLPEEVERIAPQFGEMVASNQPIIDLENWNRRKDGREVCLLTSGVPVLDEQGELLGYRGVDSDITERKRAEAELREQQTLLRSIIDTSPDWIFAKDTNYRYLLVNKSFAEFYGGLSPEEMVGKDDYDLGTPAELIEGDPEQGIVGFRVDDRAVVEGHETIHNPNDVVDHTDGTRHVYDTNKLPLRDANGNVIGVLGVSRDMTDQRVQEEVIRKRAVEMQAVAEVGAEAAATLDPDELLQTVTDLTQERFGLYHAHIYLLDETGQNLVLTAGAGEIGQQMVATGHTIALDSPRSLVARAARASEAVVVNNVRVAPDFLPNPRLPRTRAEMAVPMIVGDQLIGVLDVQASEIDYFTDADVQVQSTLASQVAVAVQNAWSFRDAVDAEAELREQQTLLRSIIDTSPDWIFAKDTDYRYLLVNKPFAEFYGGLSPEEMVGKDDYDLGTPAELIEGDPEQGIVGFRVDDRAVVEGHETIHNPNDVVDHTDGTRHVYDTNKLPLRDANGNVIGVLGVSRDVTEQRAQEEVIRKRAVEMQTVAEVSSEAAASLDPTGLLRNVSELTKERFDLYHVHVYLLDEMGQNLVLAAGAGDPGRLMVQAGHRIPLDREQSLVAQSARTRRAVVSNRVTQSPDFLPNPMLPRTKSELAVPMIVGDQLIGVLDVQASETDRFTDEDMRVQTTLAAQVAVAVQNARLYAEQVEAADRLREVDRLKSEFLASMSHELRTPLNSIIGYAEVLLDGIDGDLTEDMEEDIGAIHGSGKLLLNLINDILDLAKIEAGQMDLVAEDFEFRSLAQDMINTARVLIMEKQVDLVIDIPDDLPLVHGDALRIRQVLNNILSNAAKFTEEGDIVLAARVDADDPRMLRVSISDSGIGMTPEQQAVIFDRFRQVDQSHTRRAGGTGLGLSITQQLVEMHGGRIWVESEANAGSTFHFTLPLAEE